PDRPPHLHDGEAALQQLVGLVGEQVAHTLWARPFRVIVVHASHHLADLARFAQFIIRRTQGVIEDDDARGAAFGFYQRFHLRIIDAADLLLVEEVGDLGVVTNETEAVAIEHEWFRLHPRIANGHAAGIGRAPAAHTGCARHGGLREYLLAVIENVIDPGLDRFADRVPLENLCHGQLLDVPAASSAPSAEADCRMI